MIAQQMRKHNRIGSKFFMAVGRQNTKDNTS